jgi:SAM-dependent methyltransferase
MQSSVSTEANSKRVESFPLNYHEIHLAYDPARSSVWRVICRYLQRFVRDDLGLVDLGAGYGDLSRFIRASEKWALDTSPEMIQYWGQDIHPLVQSALDPLPLATGSVGTVVASNFFEHFTIDQCQTILLEVKRILRTNGKLIVIQPNFRLEPFRYFDDYTHKTPFTDAGFTNLLRSLGWRMVHSEPRFLPFSMRSRLPKWGWLVRIYLMLPYRPRAGQFLVIAEHRDS